MSLEHGPACPLRTASGGKFATCLTYEGTSNNSNEPKQLGAGADGAQCKSLNANVAVRTEYKPSDTSVAATTPPAAP